MENSTNYPVGHMAKVEATPTNAGGNPGAAQIVGYEDCRGKAATMAGPNYSGAPGTGYEMPKNHPKAP